MLIDLMKKLILLIASKVEPRTTYRPERHYMRGPGPETKARSVQPGEPNRVEA
jgi:hypothetical protein